MPVRGNAARVLLQPVHPRDLPPAEGNGEARQDGQQTVQHVPPASQRYERPGLGLSRNDRAFSRDTSTIRSKCASACHNSA